MIVLWDRDCGFCAWTLALLLRWDRSGALRPAAIQGPEGDRLLAGMPPEERLASWHAVDGDGVVRSGGAGLSAVFERLRGGRVLARATAAQPSVTDAAYRWVAAHRSQLSRLIGAGAKERARRLIAARSDPSETVTATEGATCARPA
jgi:predicted DCC family thiol-disulfide oxidoreductase YuxK